MHDNIAYGGALEEISEGDIEPLPTILYYGNSLSINDGQVLLPLGCS